MSRILLARMKTKSKSPERKPLSKIMWSWVGSFLGMYLLARLEKSLLNSVELMFLIGSFGASAVLIYGAPLAEFSQPINLVGGHVTSSLIGVTIARMEFLGQPEQVALAVSLAIVAMHFTVTMHPPGGATALIAVIGGPAIHRLGYFYVICPVLAGALILLLVALFSNNLSSNPKRHYPTYWI